MERNPGNQDQATSERLSHLRARVLDFALDHVREAIFLIDEHARFRHVNEEACRSLGYAQEEMLGLSVSDINPGFPPDRWSDHWNRLKTQGSLTFESQQRAKDGRIFPVEVNANYFEYDGQAFYLGLVRDTTERQRAEEALRTSETRLRSFVDHATDAFFIHDDRGRVHDVNLQACACLGYAREEMLGMAPTDLDPDVDEDFLIDLRARLATGEIVSLERRHRRKDGTTFPVEVRLRPFWVGERRFTVALARDVTERKQVERRLGRLNRTYAVLSDINQLIVRVREPRAIVDGACRIAVEKGGLRMAWIGMLDPGTGIVRPTSAAGIVDGYLDAVRIDVDASPGAEWLTMQGLLSGEHQICNDVAQDPRMQIRGEEALRRGYRALAAFPLTVAGRIAGTFNLYADEAGFFDADEVHLLHELALDIAFALDGCEREKERQRATEELRKREELFRELAETIQEVFWVTDPTGHRMHYISPAYEKIWGRSCQSLYERPGSWADAIHEDDRPRVLHAAATQQTEGRYDEEYRIVRPDGQLRWIRDRAFPVHNTATHVERIVGVAEDITESRQIAEQLRQSQKMEAIGQLAGGIAHDFNNILTLMAMQVELTTMVKDLPSEALEYVREVGAAAGRAAQLTRQLLLFSRRQVMQPQEVDLNDLVTNLAKMLQRFIGEDVRLQLHLHPRPVIARVDAGMIDQLLMNLAVNARDAMPDGGGLTIITAATVLDDTPGRAHPEAAPGHYVSLTVSDTGEGIKPAVLPHIFEPFFTTKEPGKGTGLGLATVFGIVKQHRGSISVDSEPGRGTTFQIILPASDGAPGAVIDAAVPPRLRGGRETILLVEDEPTVRAATSAVLAHHGYQLLEACNGVEALKMWHDPHNRVALLLTDLVMPGGVSGRDLARQLKLDRPDLKVIYTSGYSEDIAGRQLELSPGEAFLPKPFQLSELLKVIRGCLDARSAGADGPPSRTA